MILAALMMVAGPTFTEVVEPGSELVSVQAVAMLPALSSSEKELLPLMVEAIRVGVGGYPTKDLRDVSQSRGPDVTLSSDSIRLGITVAKIDGSSAIPIVSAMLHSARFSAKDLQQAADNMHRSIWSEAVLGSFATPPEVRADDLLKLYAKVFQPKNLTFASGGAIITGEAKKRWDSTIPRWFAGGMPRILNFSKLKVDFVKPEFTPMSAIEFTHPIASLTPADLLAMIALGSGKGSSLFRIARQQLGITYRAESALTPAATGFDEKLIITTEATLPAETAPRVQSALAADVDSWTETQRERAIGMSQAILAGNSPFGPMYLSGDEPLSAFIGDRTFLSAYWKAKTDTDWNAATMLTQMRQVSLEDLKASAKLVVSGTLSTRRL